MHFYVPNLRKTLYGVGVGIDDEVVFEFVSKNADIIFFDWEPDGMVNHVGIVEKVENIIEVPEEIIEIQFTIKTTKSKAKKVKDFLLAEGIEYE